MATHFRSQRPPPFLSRLVEAFPGGVAYLDNRLIFTFCNDAQAAYFGRKREAVIGQSLDDVTPDNPEFWREIERVAETGIEYPQTALAATWQDRQDEGEHHFLVSYIADLDHPGAMCGVFMTALDVTQAILHEREVEEGLRERNKVLEETVRERDILVGIVSHELRTPLTTIFGNAHMLLRRLEDMDAESRTRAVTDIQEEAERLNRLVENMLLLARASAQTPVPTEPILLDKVINGVILEHSKLYNRRRVTLVVKPPNLMADGQSDYMRRVVQNLLSNAEKYSPGDEPIDIQARRTGEAVIISVYDHGSGIKPEEAEIIFQAFYRSPRTSARVSGAGIGLAVCKLLVQARSGRIWARPRRGGGSVFSFTLPAVS